LSYWPRWTIAPVSVASSVDEESRSRAARLTLPGEVHAAQRAVDREIQIGVGEHDDRVLAAELERDGLDDLRRGARLDPSADRRRADERQSPDARMHGQRVAGLGAVAGDDLDEPGGQDRVDQLLQPQRGQRRVLGRLEDHRVAGDQRRAEPPGREHQRVVERDDPADHAERLGQRVVEALEAGRDGVAAQLEG
jgi:hypothetical protein